MIVLGQLISVRAQGSEGTPQQHKPPNPSTKPVTSARGRFTPLQSDISLHYTFGIPYAGEHSSVQVHKDGVYLSSDYHISECNQEQSSTYYSIGKQ